MRIYRSLLIVVALISLTMVVLLSGCERDPVPLDINAAQTTPVPDIRTEVDPDAAEQLVVNSMPGSEEVAIIDQALAAKDAAQEPTREQWERRIASGLNGLTDSADQKYMGPIFANIHAGDAESPYGDTWIPPNVGSSDRSVTLYQDVNDDDIQGGLWAIQGALSDGVADHVFSLPFSKLTAGGYPAFPARCKLEEGMLTCRNLGQRESDPGEWSESILERMVLPTVRNLDVLEGELICGDRYCMEDGVLVGRMSAQAYALINQPTQCMVRAQNGARQCNVAKL